MHKHTNCDKCTSSSAEWNQEKLGWECPLCYHITNPGYVGENIPTEEIWPGDRVEVWNHLEQRLEEGIVVKRYGVQFYIDDDKVSGGYFDNVRGGYADMVDVRYDSGYEWSDGISKGHFTYGAKLIKEELALCPV